MEWRRARRRDDNLDHGHGLFPRHILAQQVLGNLCFIPARLVEFVHHPHDSHPMKQTTFDSLAYTAKKKQTR
uniref:hypothetical protein n=1 Tax=Aquimonas sp. TaxID=1872588 RepID=UPI0037BF9C21